MVVAGSGNGNVTLAMHWSIIPNTGLLPRANDGSIRVALPASYHRVQ